MLGFGSARWRNGAATITAALRAERAAVPGVTVTATNQATNVPYPAMSNAAGNYTITSLPVGMYVVKAELTGFKTPTTKPFPLEAKQIARLDLKLDVGSLEDRVEVTAEAPVLQTETATVGEVLSAKTVESLPLNALRSSLASCPAPSPPTPAARRTRRPRPGARPYVNGNRERRKFRVDGSNQLTWTTHRLQPTRRPGRDSVETNNSGRHRNVAAGHQQRHQWGPKFAATFFEFYRPESSTRTPGAEPLGAPRRAQQPSSGTPGGPSGRTPVILVNYQGTVLDTGHADQAVARGRAQRRPSSPHRDPRPRTGRPSRQQDPLNRQPTASHLNSPFYPDPTHVTGVAGTRRESLSRPARTRATYARLNASPTKLSCVLHRGVGDRTKESFELFSTRSKSPFRKLAVNKATCSSPRCERAPGGYNRVFKNERTTGAGGNANASSGSRASADRRLAASSWERPSNIGSRATIEEA